MYQFQWQRTLMWWKYGEQGDNWTKAEINVTGPTEYRLLFEAKAGQRHGEIALDDIRVNYSHCSV